MGQASAVCSGDRLQHDQMIELAVKHYILHYIPSTVGSLLRGHVAILPKQTSNISQPNNNASKHGT